jgi:HSP20 family molecular chaperone IbpA
MDSGSIRDKNNNDIIQLNNEFQNRKKKLIEASSKEIEQLKRIYDEKELDIKTRGEASISHLRQQTSQNLNSEHEQSKKNIENTKQSMQEYTKVYEKNLSQQRQAQQNRLKRVQEQFENQRTDTITEGNKKITTIENSHQEKLNVMQKRQKQQLYEVQKQNVSEAEHIQRTGKERNDTVHTTYENQLSNLHDQGNKKITHEKDAQRQQITKIKTDLKKEKEHEFSVSRKAIDAQNAQFKSELENTKEQHKKEMLSNYKKYQGDIINREKQMRDSLKAQDHTFAKELVKQKIDWAQKMGPITDKDQDSFYRIIDRSSKFTEEPDAYILKAFIPEYDRDSISIRVQDDKVSVSGNRSFKDLAQDGNRRISSSQYQSFKEDFVFKQPIVAKAAIHSHDGDFVTVSIPKLTQLTDKDDLA